MTFSTVETKSLVVVIEAADPNTATRESSFLENGRHTTPAPFKAPIKPAWYLIVTTASTLLKHCSRVSKSGLSNSEILIGAQEFYDSVINEYTEFTKNTGCYFSDVFPNNILVNEDYSDFRLIDIGCLKMGDEIQKPSFEQVITGGAANNIGFIK